jgi:hypothetical protein
MNVCKLRNWLANYIGWYFERNSFKDKMYSEKETTLGNLIFCILMAMFVTVFFSWNIYLIRIVGDLVKPILDKKYVCDNYKAEQE